MKKPTYILDTNAILYNPEIIYDLKDADIVIPQVVLQELDKIKLTSNDRDLRYRARKAARFLFDLAEKGTLTEGIELENGSTVRVAVFDPNKSYPENLSIRNSDDKILAIAYQVINDTGSETTLVTNDLNMLLKAQILGLSIHRFVEEPATFLEKIGNRLKLGRRFKAAYPFIIVLLMGAFAVFMGMQVIKAGNPKSDLPPELQAQYEFFKIKEQEYKRILSDDPQNFQALVGLANLYFDNQQYQQAIDYYRKALKVQPNNPDVRTDMAISYFYLNLNDLAVSELQKVVKSHPNHAKARYNLAVIYRRMGNLEAAKAEFEAFLKLVPYGPDAEFAANQLSVINELLKQRGAQ